MSDPILGLVALGVLFIVIFIGFPIAFTLAAVAIGTGYIALGPRIFDLAVLQTFSVMRDTVLASVPFFLLMASCSNSRAGGTALPGHPAAAGRHAWQPVPGHADHRHHLCGGHRIVGSAVTLLGVMAGPSMIKSGYDTKMSAGAIAAGGTLGILIPPSVMLIVMGPVVGIPATDLFAAAVIPGLMLAAIFTGLLPGALLDQPGPGPGFADVRAFTDAGPR